ncbi:MAG: 50S ribosomal protein L7/L12 [Candidatus Bipolaricaulia bacterium]
MATMSKDDILEAIDEMTVKDLHALVKDLEEKYDVSAQAAVAAAPAAGGGTAAEGGEEEAAASTVDVKLTNAGQQKVQLIKKVKEITGKGLKECKELADDLPATIKEGVDEDEAQNIREQLEEYGAEVDIS